MPRGPRGVATLYDTRLGHRIRVQGLVLIEARPLAEQGYRDGATQIRIVAHPAHPLTIGRA